MTFLLFNCFSYGNSPFPLIEYSLKWFALERDNNSKKWREMSGTILWEWMKKFIPTSFSNAFCCSIFPCRELYFVFPPLLSIKQRLKQMSSSALILSLWSEQCLIIRETLMLEKRAVPLLPADGKTDIPAQSLQILDTSANVWTIYIFTQSWISDSSKINIWLPYIYWFLLFYYVFFKAEA